MSAPDMQELRRRAGSGDVAALTLLGRKLLVGEGVAQAPAEALACLRDASARGGGEATSDLALLAAWGVLRPRSFEAALDLLQRAAELGHPPAQAELRLLAGTGGADWAALRRGVDPEAWTRARPARELSAAPRIQVLEGFASAAECDWLVARGQGDLRRARVYRHDASGHVESGNRTNTESDYTVFRSDVVQALVRERIAASIGADSRCFEVAKLLHYEPGQQFGLHADFILPATPALAEDVRLHGQRVTTFLIYLNDDYQGGETEFPRIGLRYKGGKGDALCFSNVDESGAPDQRSVHAGLPPASGVKWLYSQWVRSKPPG
ncbi:MAG: 2OG-Fe(II) oxygenase [Steroidobacteraceae bacterium]|nr:2OG-Fe(II) oxygenase [Steroidobacteraceae bacterium]